MSLRLRSDQVDDHPRDEPAQRWNDEEPDRSDRCERDERRSGRSRLRLRVPGECFEHIVQRPPEEPVEQDRPQARDDPDAHRQEHEAELQRESGQLPRKQLP